MEETGSWKCLSALFRRELRPWKGGWPKPNQVGTLSEAWDTARYAQAHGDCLVPSGRAGGSVDDPIPDIAVAVGAALIKCGAPRTGERIAGQNRLLRIEEELGASATFATLESWL